MGLCGTTHKRVCRLRSSVGGQLRAITQIDLHFGLTYKSEGCKSLYDGKERKERGIGEKPL